MEFKETSEQINIINKESQFLLINAYAGTGKTTTLIKYTELRPSYKFLYLAFNKSIALEAYNKFPKNVKILTAHSIAYKFIGHKYKNKLKDIKHNDIKNILKENFSYTNNLLNNLSKNLLISINDYCYSAYSDIKDVLDFSKDYGIKKEEYIVLLKFLWDKIIDLNSSFPINHDVYLKLFQLSKYKLNYDYILFDEAQDANPAIIDIILNQNVKYKTKTILIGDVHQSIYSFRGSENSFKKLKNKDKMYLTQSFRFGNNISNALNAILKSLKNEKKEIKGNYNINDSIGDINLEENFTILTRTNSNLFLKACELAEKNKKMYFIGGIDSYNFFKIKDIENLYNGDNSKIRDSYISSFNTFESFYREIKELEDNEMIYLSRIVDKYKGNTKEIIKKIRNLTVQKIEFSDVALSTVHKAKGLEFNQVWLSNDFVDFINEDLSVNLNILKEEEINILYVAASRAKKALRYNYSLKKIIDYYNNNFEKIENKIRKDKKSIVKIKNKLKKFDNKFNYKD